MLLDRETMIDVQTRRGTYWAEGLPFDLRFHTAVGAGWDGYWVDPQSDAFGPNAQYLRFNLEEAKRLISAAGYEDGIDAVLHFSGGLQYGGGYVRTAELVSGMLAEGGIRLRLESHDYTKDWLPNYYFAYAAARNGGKAGKGFNGLIYRPALQQPHPVSQVFAEMHRDGIYFEGMTPDGKSPEAGDPQVNNAIAAMRREFDLKKQQEMAQNFARMMAKLAYVIPNTPYSALGFTLTWPVLSNVGAYHGWPTGSALTEANLHLWIDSTKPPLGPG
jgi:ABC-type transport system substrate-binding protein